MSPPPHTKRPALSVSNFVLPATMHVHVYKIETLVYKTHKNQLILSCRLQQYSSTWTLLRSRCPDGTRNMTHDWQHLLFQQRILVITTIHFDYFDAWFNKRTPEFRHARATISVTMHPSRTLTQASLYTESTDARLKCLKSDALSLSLSLSNSIQWQCDVSISWLKSHCYEHTNPVKMSSGFTITTRCQSQSLTERR